MHDHPDPAVPLVRVLGDVSLHHGGRRVPLPPGGHRLLGYLAVHPAGVHPRQAAAALWPASDEERAASNLRSAVWRLQLLGCPLLHADPTTLRLLDHVDVDLTRLDAWAARVLSGAATPDDLAVDPEDVSGADLLPGCSEDWVLAVRDGLHRRLVRAREEAGARSRRPARSSPAMEAVHGTAAPPPVRSSAPPAPTGAHRGARHQGIRRGRYDGIRRLLRREPGAGPGRRPER